MKKHKYGFFRRKLSMALAFTLCLSGLNAGSGAGTAAKAASDKISIGTAEELAKIGSDPNYPLDGDYELANDITLSGAWTPIGGSDHDDYGRVSGDGVFTGTLDGKGHKIVGMTITYNGNTNQDMRNQSGLFSTIGSDSASDYTEVRNIVFEEVQITHKLGGGDSIGTLAGDVNGYARIDNIAVLSGSIQINNAQGGDLVGVGGIVGQVRTNGQGVQMTNLYNAATVTVDSAVGTSPVRCGGILGRIHQDMYIGKMESCLNTGAVTFKGNLGYAINGCSASEYADANTRNISKCYYAAGTGRDYGNAVSLTEDRMNDPAVAKDMGEEYWSVEYGTILPTIAKGEILAPIPSPTFAEGDSASSVTKDFTVPTSYKNEGVDEAISWSSDKPQVIAIQGGTAVVYGVFVDTVVTLTAQTASGRTKEVKVTVVSNLKVSVNQEYPRIGTPMTAKVENAPADKADDFSYTWTIGKETVSTTDTYTPTEKYLNNFITVTATYDGNRVATLEMYYSKLPVVYLDTADGYGITSKEVYKDASMRIQGNDRYNSHSTTLYDGGISVRGRGNSTWNTRYSKLPYKIKLDKKTDLLGFGKGKGSKHWTLLANYMDESLVRNTTSYDLSGAMGMNYLPSTHVELILNGVYAGNYQLVGNVRIDKSRVDIHDWEDLAEDVVKKLGITDKDAEDYFVQHLDWITEDTFTYGETTYQREQWEDLLPKNGSEVDLSGGYLFELDEYYDEKSKFMTDADQPIMFKSPEFANTNKALFDWAQNYIQAVENSFCGEDFYVTYDGKKQHYTELVDMDSLVRYFLLNEFFWNTETMKKSTYMYKELGEKLYIGPVWDMDWTSASLVSQSETDHPEEWMTVVRGVNAQKEQWYKQLIKDPYFLSQVYECYQENRSKFEDIIKDGGILDRQKEYLQESAARNYEMGYLKERARFETEIERLDAFLTRRLNWMDTQFASVETLVQSLNAYRSESGVSLVVDVSSKPGVAVCTATVSDSNASKVNFYVNGILAGTVDVQEQKAVYEVPDTSLETAQNDYNVVQVRAADANGNLLSKGAVTDYKAFQKAEKAAALTGTVVVEGTPKVGFVLEAKVTGTNNTGTLRYQWMAGGEPIPGAVMEKYRPTEKEIGKTITVVVTSSEQTESLTSEATEAIAVEDVTIKEVVSDHLIINQVYGGGANDGTPISHSFIELYNPTSEEISLKGYSLGYLSGGKKGSTTEEVKLALDESKKIPAKTSYLIRCEAQDTTVSPDLVVLTIDKFDQEWEDRIIDNKRYRIVLYNGEDAVDGLSVGEAVAEGVVIAEGTPSKQKSLRRKNFLDTDNNANDFEQVVYEQATQATVAKYRPRSLADGAWDASTVAPVDPGTETDPKFEGTLSIRGNAIVGATLYADLTGANNTGTLSYQWFADGRPVEGGSGAFLAVDESLLNKTISVSVTSSEPSGFIRTAMSGAVKAVTPQRTHLIINQVYGGGQTSKGGAAVSHSFIELYNPGDAAVSLDGYNIDYLSGGKSAKLDLEGGIEARTSYLIRCAAETDTETKRYYTIETADAQWDQVIDNKQYRIALKKGEELIDGVSVNEDSIEGEPLKNPEGDEIISKNKSIRRINFIDTDVNVNDFEVLNYSKLPEEFLEAVVPRSAASGSWGLTGSGGTVDPENPDNPDNPDNPENPDDPGNPGNPDKQENSGNSKDPGKIVTLQAPKMISVKSMANKKLSQVAVKFGTVKDAAFYEIYRRKGGKTVMIGTAADGIYYDTKPVAGKVFYFVKAASGSARSAASLEQAVSIPKATKKLTAKASGKKAVTLRWKRVKGATGYMIYRSAQKDAGYRRIKTLKKAKSVTYTDRKVKGGKKYFYRIVTVKKKTYSPAKTSKVVKIKK